MRRKTASAAETFFWGDGNGRTLAGPRAVFIDFAFAGDSDHMPSSGQKLELHLKVAVLLPDAIESAPSAVADEEPGSGRGCRVGRDAPAGYVRPLIEPYVQFSRIRLTVWNL